MIYKPSVLWQKITEVIPEPNQECLVWSGRHMFVATAEIYTAEELKQNAEWADSLHLRASEETKNSLKTCKGRFQEFGHKSYFDDPGVYWSPIPLAPGEKNPPPPDPFEDMVSRDVYLTKTVLEQNGEALTSIVGIHAIGYENPENPAEFMQMEIWGNEYNEDHEMLGRGSFRVFDELENEVKNWEADGWVRRDPPKKKEKA